MAHTNTSKSPLHFARFEFKYILSAAQRKVVEADLLYFLEFDPFVVDRADNKYLVRSLYFDDPSYSAFYNKVDGLHSRSKFRLRTYSRQNDENIPLFLEIKGRHNNLVFKHRTPIKRDGVNWGEISGESLTETILRNAQQGPVRDRFEFELLRKRLSPVALIDYHRRPYISKYDSEFRVTFDEELFATNSEGLFLGENRASRKALPGYAVLEVKFRHHMPSWFHRVIQAHELRRVSISKICSGMEALGLAHDLN